MPVSARSASADFSRREVSSEERQAWAAAAVQAAYRLGLNPAAVRQETWRN